MVAAAAAAARDASAGVWKAAAGLAGVHICMLVQSKRTTNMRAAPQSRQVDRDARRLDPQLADMSEGEEEGEGEEEEYEAICC
jgi:hypothetical protein